MILNNPYKGLFQYTSKDEEYFFGREKETTDLVEMIRNNQLVVLYGESGTGKTSLINAKLFPELKRNYYFPIYIRLNFLNNVDPLAQIRDKMYSELKQWDPDVPEFSEDITLVEYAARTSLFNGLVKPILFFDQFEELFTLGQKYVQPGIIEKFLVQLADLIEVRLPVISSASMEASGTETVSKEVCTENALRYTVVLSMRQDYIAQLDDLRFKIPSISYNRYRIKKFDDRHAKDAIIKPAEVYVQQAAAEQSAPLPAQIIDETTANEIIRQLKKSESEKYISIAEPVVSIGDGLRRFIFFGKKNSDAAAKEEQKYYNYEIDPTILSLYCHQLYKEAPITHDGTKKITQEQVKKSPCDKVIENYYNESLPARRIKTATENYLITPDGRRTLLLLRDFAEKSKIDENTVDILKEKTGIFRIYGEGLEREVELAHDQIAKRSLINKREREAKKITTMATIFSGLVLLGIVSISIASVYYVEKQKNSYKVETLLAEKATADSTITSLQGDVKKTTDSLNVYRDAYSDLSSTKELLVNDNTKISSLIKNLQYTIKDQKAEIEAKELFVKNVSMQYTNAVDNLANANMNFKEEQERHKNDNEKSGAIIAKLQDDLDDKKKAYDQLAYTYKTDKKNLTDSVSRYKSLSEQYWQKLLKLQKLNHQQQTPADSGLQQQQGPK